MTLRLAIVGLLLLAAVPAGAQEADPAGTAPAPEIGTTGTLPEEAQLLVASLAGSWRVTGTDIPNAAEIMSSVFEFAVHDAAAGRFSVRVWIGDNLEEEDLRVMSGTADSLVVADSTRNPPTIFKFVNATEIDLRSEEGTIHIQRVP